MKIGAIVCEYNPLHNGHKYHIHQTKHAGITHIVSIMSGDFVQRGEPAVVSKWRRAEMALCEGSDLVVELPTILAVACAEKFAYNSVFLVNSLGCVDVLSFGSESADINTLNKIATLSDTPSFKENLHANLAQGLTLAKAFSETLLQSTNVQHIEPFNRPNDILAIEYIKSLRKLHSRTQPLAIKRLESPCNDIASASFIRNLLITSNNTFMNYLPKSSCTILQSEITSGFSPANIATMERAILAKLKTMPIRELKEITDVSEGLENRIATAVHSATSLDELIMSIKSKRYTYARIRRIILCSFLGIQAHLSSLSPNYIRILGMNNKGAEILNKAKSTTSLPIISKFSDIEKYPEIKPFFDFESRCSDLYSMFTPKIRQSGTNLSTKLITEVYEKNP